MANQPLIEFAIATIGIIFLSDSCFSQQPDPIVHLNLVSKAAELKRRRDFNAAAAIYEQVVREDPDNGDLLVLLGKAYQNAGDARKAVEAYTRAANLGFGSAYTSLDAASACARIGQKQQAIDWLERALSERLDGRTQLSQMPEFSSLIGDPRFRRLAGMPPPGMSTRIQRWQFDLLLLAEEVHRLHASPRHEKDSPAWESALDLLMHSIPKLSDDELMLGIQRLVVMLNDG